MYFYHFRAPSKAKVSSLAFLAESKLRRTVPKYLLTNCEASATLVDSKPVPLSRLSPLTLTCPFLAAETKLDS